MRKARRAVFGIRCWVFGPDNLCPNTEHPTPNTTPRGASAMSKPIVAIVGRPNVGKSTLFNRLIGERKAIVEDTPGITRDRVYGHGDWRGREMIFVDTGGLAMGSDDPYG